MSGLRAVPKMMMMMGGGATTTTATRRRTSSLGSTTIDSSSLSSRHANAVAGSSAPGHRRRRRRRRRLGRGGLCVVARQIKPKGMSQEKWEQLQKQQDVNYKLFSKRAKERIASQGPRINDTRGTEPYLPYESVAEPMDMKEPNLVADEGVADAGVSTGDKQFDTWRDGEDV